jgi:hypothetical protein
MRGIKLYITSMQMVYSVMQYTDLVRRFRRVRKIAKSDC